MILKRCNMEKYALGIFSFVAIIAISVFFMDSFSADYGITGEAVQQAGMKVSVGKMPTRGYIPQGTKTAQTGLIIWNGMPYILTAMQGIISIQGLPISVDLLKQKGITLVNGKLATPNKKDVQIKDVEMRRKPIKLTFRGK